MTSPRQHYQMALIILLCTLCFSAMRADPSPEKVIKIEGKEMTKEDATDRVVAMLSSNDANKAEMVKEVLSKNLVLLLNADQKFDDRLVGALVDYCIKQPPYSLGLEITKKNSKELFTSPRVAILCFLVLYGGEKGEAVLKKSLSSDHPVERTIAEGIKEMAETNRKRKKPVVEDVENGSGLLPTSADLTVLTNTVIRIFSERSTTEKTKLLRDIRRQEEKLRSAENKHVRIRLVSILKQYFSSEENLAVKEELIKTIVILGEVKTTSAFLDGIINDEDTQPLIKQRAVYLKKLLDLGAFE